MAAATCTLRLMWANTEVKQVIENVNVDLFVAHVQKMIVDGWPKGPSWMGVAAAGRSFIVLICRMAQQSPRLHRRVSCR